MKSAEEFWAAEYPDSPVTSDKGKERWGRMVEAIREEMRRECAKAASKAQAVADASKRLDGRIWDAILSAGKPQLKKGQLVCWEGGVTKTKYIGPYDEHTQWGSKESASMRPLRWSDLCDEYGKGYACGPGAHGGSDDVFLKEAMEEELPF